jgi:hypothetical protein
VKWYGKYGRKLSFHNFLLYFPNFFTIQLGFLPYFSYLFTIQVTFPLYFPNFFTILKGKLNSEKIWKLWKKSKLNSEKIWKIWKKRKLNSDKIWKIEKKIVKTSVFSQFFHYFLLYFPNLFTLQLTFLP